MQPTVPLSSTEAEYRVLTVTARDVIHFCRLLNELGFDLDNSTQLLSDNQSCLKLVKNLVMHARTKHIKIQHHFIMEVAKARAIQVGDIPTNDQ